MDNSLVFTPGCKWVIENGVLLFIEYESVSGAMDRMRFDIYPETEYITDGYKLETISNICAHADDLFIQKVEYYEKECNLLIGGKMRIPTKVYFEAKAKKTAEELHNKLILRNDTNSAYGIASRDWGDVLADSARYIYAKQSTFSQSSRSSEMYSGTLSHLPSFSSSSRPIAFRYSSRSSRRGSLSKLVALLSHNVFPLHLEPNTKLIDPNALYFQDTTTGEMKPYEGVKNITPMAMTKEEMQYCLNDVAVTEKLFKEEQIMRFDSCKPTIKNVIFNDPATIVMWSDGTKTVVKCGEGDTFDPEKGVAMCCMKKLLGTNKTGSNYLDKVQEYFDAYDEDYIEECKTIGEILKEIWGDAFGPTQLPAPDVNTGAMDIPPEETVEKEFEAVTSSDWTFVPADENKVAEENGE